MTPNTQKPEIKPSEALADEPEPSQFKQTASRNWLAGRRGLVAGIGIGVVVTAGAMSLLPIISRSPAPTNPEETTSVPGQSVTVASVETGTVNRVLEATGTVAAPNLLPILPKVTGLQVQQVFVEEGDWVKAGQVMAVLDNSVLQAQLSQAQAQLRASQAALRQKQAGVAESQSNLGQKQAGLAQAQADLLQSRAALGEARAKLAQTQREYTRYRSLASRGAISRQDLDVRSTAVATAQESVRAAQAQVTSAQAQANSARASVGGTQASIGGAQADTGSAEADVRNNEAKVRQAQTQLAQAQVLAPRSGIVAEKIVRVGDVTSGSQKLFSVIQDGSLELQAKVPETQLPEVRVGSPVQIRSDADNLIKLQGRVREIAPLVDPQTRQATIKIDLPASQLLRPGIFLRATIVTGQVQGLTVAARAVLPQANGRTLVYRLEGRDTVRAQTVEVGETLGGGDATTAKIEIKSGLNLGDRVVVKGAGYLKNGDRVFVVSNPF